MDLEKLKPGPWVSPKGASGVLAWASERGWEFVPREEVAEFTVLARNALDVMMRRGWHPVRGEGYWYVWGWVFPRSMIQAADPFTALVKADEWYRLNVEGKEHGQGAGTDGR